MLATTDEKTEVIQYKFLFLQSKFSLISSISYGTRSSFLLMNNDQYTAQQKLPKPIILFDDKQVYYEN